MTHDPAQTPTADFPRLTPTNHRVTSPRTKTYNCVAWAAGEVHRWWEPGQFWPCQLLGNDFKVADMIEAFRTIGYELCANGVMETGFEKVAIYAEGFVDPTHASRQLSDGRWTSKIGPDEDIEHDTADDVAGGLYGDIIMYMRRPVP